MVSNITKTFVLSAVRLHLLSVFGLIRGEPLKGPIEGASLVSSTRSPEIRKRNPPAEKTMGQFEIYCVSRATTYLPPAVGSSHVSTCKFLVSLDLNPKYKIQTYKTYNGRRFSPALSEEAQLGRTKHPSFLFPALPFAEI